jgi:biopolymer transport protein ExbD
MKYTILFASAFMLMTSCRQQAMDTVNNDSTFSLESAPPIAKQTDDADVLKVYVEKNGTIFANGTQVTIDELDNQLKQLKAKNGIVWYSRDNLSDDPSREAMAAVNIILQYELSVKFYADKNFTKAADF